MPPVIRDSWFFHKAIIISTAEINMSTQTSVNKEPLTPSGLITADKPRTNIILKILLPIRLPKAISASPFIAADTDVVNSGRDVPIATIVNPTSA